MKIIFKHYLPKSKGEATKNPGNLHQKYFPYLSHLANSGCVKRPKSKKVTRIDTILISLFFLQVQTVIIGLTIPDFLLLRVRKLMYCRQWFLMKMLAIRAENQPIHILQYPPPIVITSIPFHRKNSHTSINQLLSLILILNFSLIYYHIFTGAPSYHSIQSSIKIGCKMLPSHFGIMPQQQL